MQFVGGLKGRTLALFERQLVDLERAVEVRIGLPRSPGGGHHSLERAVRKEIDPLAVGTPAGARAVVAIAGERGERAVFDAVEIRSLELVRAGDRECQPARSEEHTSELQ